MQGFSMASSNSRIDEVKRATGGKQECSALDFLLVKSEKQFATAMETSFQVKSKELSGVSAVRHHQSSRTARGRRNGSAGLTLIELLIVMAIGIVLTALAMPVINSALTSMRLNSMANSITSAIGKARYRAIMNSQPYSLVLSTPVNSYVVTNLQTQVADKAVPLPSTTIAVNGGAAAIYTYTFCPNGTVYGAGGACPGGNLPPALALTYQNRQINMAVSSVGNVTATTIH